MSTLAAAGLLLFCAFVCGVIVYFYALLFYASIVQAFGANHTLTLEHYRVIFSEGLPAIKDTLIIALIGMPLGGLYGVVVGYLVGRGAFIGRRAMELSNGRPASRRKRRPTPPSVLLAKQQRRKPAPARF